MAKVKHRYSRVSRKMVADEKFRRLSPPPPCGQWLFTWLLVTNEQCLVPGLIRMGEAGMAEAIGWDLKGFREAFAEVSREGLVKVDWEARLVWIPNRIKHDEPANPNVVLGWSHDWEELPECELKREAHSAIYSHLSDKGEPWAKAFEKACGKGSAKGSPKGSRKQNQDQDQDQKGVDEPKNGPQSTPEAPPSPCPPPTAPPGLDRDSILAELRKHHALRCVASAQVAMAVLSTAMHAGKTWPMVAQAITDLAAHATGGDWNADLTRRKLHSYVKRVRAEDVSAGTAAEPEDAAEAPRIVHAEPPPPVWSQNAANGPKAAEQSASARRPAAGGER